MKKVRAFLAKFEELKGKFFRRKIQITGIDQEQLETKGAMVLVEENS